MAERPPSRLDGARKRAAAAKRALAVTSTAAFGAALIWAHASHPGTPASMTGTGTARTSVDDNGVLGGFDFGQGSLAPSPDTTPDTRTRAS